MKIKVLYRSTTGNTEKLARKIAQTCEIQAERLDGDTGILTEPVDLLFIGDGIYFGKVNKKTQMFIDRLDPKLVRNAAVFATYGGQVNIGNTLKDMLQKKGIKVMEEVFTCKGQAWKFLNRNHPNETDLKNVCNYTKGTVTIVERVSSQA